MISPWQPIRPDKGVEVAGGAPADEYEGETEMIAAAIGALPPADFTRENVMEIISYVWADSFDLDEEAIERRGAAMQSLADVILPKAD